MMDVSSSSHYSTNSTTHQTYHLHVEGMMCQRNCGTTVENAIRSVPGVETVVVSFLHQYAFVIVASSASTSYQDIVETIEMVGFDASLLEGTEARTLHFRLEGILTTTTADMVERALQQQMEGDLEGVGISTEHAYAFVTVPSFSFSSKGCLVDRLERMQQQVVETFRQKMGGTATPLITALEHTIPLQVGGETTTAEVAAALRRNKPVVGKDGIVRTSYSWTPHSLVGSFLDQLNKWHDDIRRTLETEGLTAHIVSAVPEPDDEDEVWTDATNSTATLQVKGMSCAVCIGRVEKLLSEVPGVTEATVMLTTHRAQITTEDRETVAQVAETCAQVVTKGGYECQVLRVSTNEDDDDGLLDNAQQMEEARRQELETWRNLLLLSIFLSTPLIIFHYHTFSFTASKSLQTMELILATLVQILVGHRYYRAAWKGWTNGRFLGMDFLVVLGTTAAFVLSLLMYASTHIFVSNDNGNTTNHHSTTMEDTFATGPMLFTFVTFGKFLESYAKGKTASALQTLMELQPVVALKVTNSSRIEEHNDKNNTNDDNDSSSHPAVDLASLEVEETDSKFIQVGDYLLVLPGSQIPADGILISSSSTRQANAVAAAFVDESALSGEPFPVAKTIGSTVVGGTVNQLSTLLIRVTASGKATVLAQIVQLMESAQAKKAPIEAQADKIASVFAPIVIALSLLTMLGWLICYHPKDQSVSSTWFVAIMSGISVVVVACPCALGLATPTAVMVGCGVGANHGLLIKGGAVLEGAHAVDTVIFDKTGTLTTGKAVVDVNVSFLKPDTHPEILKHVPSSLKTPTEISLWLAACAESQSEHPLGKAIVNAAKSTLPATTPLVTEDWHMIPGSGVECQISSALRVRVGNRAWITNSSTEADGELSKIRHSGRVGVYVSVATNTTDFSVVGVLGISDPVQKDAPATVTALQHHLNLDVYMCTGDDIVTATAVAYELGIPADHVCANVSPQGKAEFVTQLQEQPSNKTKHQPLNKKRVVAMIGDGINDSIALARSDVGIAIGAGTQVAVEAADMVLVRSSLPDVVVALHLSQTVFTRIRLNFGWALVYNVIALPFAAGVFYPWTEYRLPPEFASLMMAFSSVSVVTSSLLLRCYNRPTLTSSGRLRQKRGQNCCLRPRLRSKRKKYNLSYDYISGSSSVSSDSSNTNRDSSTFPPDHIMKTTPQLDLV